MDKSERPEMIEDSDFHANTGQSAYNCSICDYSFNDNSAWGECYCSKWKNEKWVEWKDGGELLARKKDKLVLRNGDATYRLDRLYNGNLWIYQDNGEGMEVSESAIFGLIDNYYKTNF